MATLKVFIAFFIILQDATFAEDNFSYVIEIGVTKNIVTTLPAPKGGDKAFQDSKTTVMLDNKTLDKFYAKIANENGDLEHFVIPPQGKKVLEIEKKNVKKLKIIPLSPPSGEILLKDTKVKHEVP